MNKIIEIIIFSVLIALSFVGLMYLINLFYIRDNPENVYMMYNKVYSGGECVGDINTEYYYTDTYFDGRDIAYTDKGKYFCANKIKTLKRWENE